MAKRVDMVPIPCAVVLAGAMIFLLSFDAWPAATSPPRDNLLVNGDFEQGGGARIPGWSPIGWGARGVLDAAVKHSGRQSLRVDGYGGVKSKLYPYHGGRVIVSVWLKTNRVVRGERPWHKAAVQVISYDPQGNPVGHSDVVLQDGTHDWQQYSKTFQYSLSVAFVGVHCHLWGRKTRGTAWFDDVRLEMPDPPQKRAPLDLERARVTVDMDKDIGPFRHLWIGSDVGYMDRVASPTQVNAMRHARKFGFRYVRMHDCIHDPHIYSERPDGTPVYDWSRFDERISAVVDNGMVPVVVLETMPPPLASHDDGLGWKNPYPPKDDHAYLKWQRLIRKVIEHCREKWGDSIHDWLFEVWNEPDARGYFKGTQAEYLRIYDHAVAGAVAADPHIRIGGPGGAGTSWIRAFLNHCRSGRNDATGRTGTRVDFLSWHMYTTGVGLPVFANINRNLEAVRRILNDFPEYKDIPTIITEWGCSSSLFPMHDRPYDAAFRAMAVRSFLDYDITYAFPFALGSGPPHAHEGFQGDLAMFTKTTIPKPSFRVFELLYRMQGRRIECRSTNDPVGGLACISPDRRTVRVLLWNLIENYRHAPYTTRVTVTMEHFPVGPWAARAIAIAPGECDPYLVWKEMGAPHTLTPAQKTRLLEASRPPPPRPLAFDGASMTVDMPGFSALFIELTRGAAASSKP